VAPAWLAGGLRRQQRQVHKCVEHQPVAHGTFGPQKRRGDAVCAQLDSGACQRLLASHVPGMFGRPLALDPRHTFAGWPRSAARRWLLVPLLPARSGTIANGGRKVSHIPADAARVYSVFSDGTVGAAAAAGMCSQSYDTDGKLLIVTDTRLRVGANTHVTTVRAQSNASRYYCRLGHARRVAASTKAATPTRLTRTR
jgi:hypothetical protein